MAGQLLSTAPLFAATDFDRTAAFYARFGYQEVARYPDQYLILRSDGAELHFNVAPAHHDPARCTNAAYVRTLNAVGLARKWADIDLPTTGLPRYVPPALRPWGMIEAHSVDPDGNLIIYGAAEEAIPPAPETDT